MTKDAEPQFLTFHVNGEEYAVRILEVREVIEYGVVTRVPTMPAFIRGVINLRGSVLPVVDLAAKIGLPLTNASRWSCIVIVEVAIDGEETVVGLLVDAVGQVLDLQSSDVAPPPAFGTRVKADCLRGVGKMRDKLVMILDLERLLGASFLAESRSATAGERPPLFEAREVTSR